MRGESVKQRLLDARGSAPRTLVVIAALAAFAGCTHPCDAFKKDPTKPVAGYPTLADKGGKNVLKVPMDYTGDPKNAKTLVAINKLEERATGGYKFKGQLPFAIKDKAKGTEVAFDKWDGADDTITPETEAILFFTISGFKGDS